MLKNVIGALAVIACGLLWPVFSTSAQSGSNGMAEPGQTGFQPAATEVMTRVEDFHLLLLWITGLVVALVFLLLLWIIIRYNRRANPVPAKTTHNTILEIVWTTIPIVILAVIAVPSLRLLYFEDIVPEADLVIEVTGHQWSWTYKYPDYDDLTFDANIIPAALFGSDLDPDQTAERARAVANLQEFLGTARTPEIHRLLDTDTRIVVPVGKVVEVLVTADDVLHAWAVPAFGIKIDAIPGRMNMTWFRADYTGTFYGQCSELCGIGHAFMPIVVEVVSEQEFQNWIEHSKPNYARTRPEADTSSVAAISEGSSEQ